MTSLKDYVSRFIKGVGSVERRAMDLSLSDGILWSVYSSMTSSYLVPLTVFILGSRDPAGLIIGMPFLIVPAAQYFAYRQSNVSLDLKKTTIWITLLDRLLWLPLLFLIFFRISFIDDVVLIIIFLSIRTFFASFSGTTWTLWVPFLISSENRNTYFSIRNFYMKIFSLVGFIIGIGIFSLSLEMKIKYTFLIIVSMVFSTASLLIMRNIPSSSLRNEGIFYRRPVDRSFIIFLFITALFVIASSGLSTYFQYYLIDKDYLSVPVTYYSFFMIVMSLSFILSQILWGKIANKIGNPRSLVIGSFLFILIPVSLLLFHSIYGALLASIIIGIVQSNSTLNIFNEMLARASAQKVKSVSSYNLIQSMAQGSGPIIANLILILLHYDIQALFGFFLIMAVASSILFIIYTLQY